MKLSPKAHRFVAEAVRELPIGRDRDRLRDWMERSKTGEDVPPDIAHLALKALQNFETRMRERLRGADEDLGADLMNDISFVRAIESDLEKMGQPARHHS
ncbi:MAG TPA: hypothetical protein VGB82_15585 [Alphaproteobacteria bacterium]